MRVLAPAKVNLYLAIKRVRPDGYHDLETIFHTVSLCDALTVSPAPKISLKVRGPMAPKGFPAGEENIVWRAAREFFLAFGIKSGVKIELVKNIPVQAGMGGGSTDAAAVLGACAKLFLKKRGPAQDRLLFKIARKLGADVPFFLMGGCAFAGGIGEKLVKLPTARFWAVIVKPKAGLSTKEVYGWYDKALAGKQPLTKAPQIRKMLVPLKARKGSRAWAGYLYNSFEDVVFDHSPEIGRVKSSILDAGAHSALLSGSGSALFGLVKSRAMGELAAKALRSQGLKTWVVRGQ